MSRNVGFLWSVFSRAWTESDTILSIYRKIRIRGSLHFGILHAMSNIITQEFFLNLITLLITWRKDAQNSEGYLYLHHSHQKAKMLLEWDCLLPCSNPRRKNAVQMDFLKEENRLTLKLTPVFELAFVCIFWDISV